MSPRKKKTDRSYMVVKANDIVQRSYFELSAQQQKIMLFLISKIKFNDEAFKEYEFNIREFCKTCGIDCNNGQNYIHLRRAIDEMNDTYIWVKTEDGWTKKIRLIETPSYNIGLGVIRLRLHEALMPYLLKLRDNYVQYQLSDCLAMNSKYSIRLYEILKSYQNIGEAQIPLEEFRILMDAKHYEAYGRLKERVIDPALKEIDYFTDLCVTFLPIKAGRSVTSIKFKVSIKNKIEDRLTAWKNAEEKLCKAVDKEGQENTNA